LTLLRHYRCSLGSENPRTPESGRSADDHWGSAASCNWSTGFAAE